MNNTSTVRFGFDNSFLSQGTEFYQHCPPTPVSAPSLIAFNEKLAADIGLDVKQLSQQQLATIFSGNQLPVDAYPIATVYAGHQFGGFAPQLGDGRAVLLGEICNAKQQRFDIQLKGSGPTPYSRGGDGRAPIGPALREYIVSEAMHALGVSTTRALALVASGDPVYRDTTQPGAIVTRVASSHLRIGHFQYFAARGNTDAVKKLADYAIARHYPDLCSTDNKYMALLNEVIDKQASLVSKWLSLGFIHGVMNTDNMTICGETIDYGPCAFMDNYQANAVFSSIDAHGRYAYSNQPAAAHWNLTRFAETLLPLIHLDQDKAIEMATLAIEKFPDVQQRTWLQVFRAKIGLSAMAENDQQDIALVKSLLELMEKHQIDFSIFFHRLSNTLNPEANQQQLRALFLHPTDIDTWLESWQQRLSLDSRSVQQSLELMSAHNPAVIPRNHQIEYVIQQAYSENFAPFHALCETLAQPQVESTRFMSAPKANERVDKTFCGT